MSSLKSPPTGVPSGDKPSTGASSAQSTMVILPLGGGQEVGRSCILLQYHGRSILLDCGIHPGREGMDACPFFDIIEPSEIDFVLITHFHLDHCASLPYFTEKTDFKGRVFMTHATKAVMRLLISDYIKLQFSGSRHSGNALYDDEDLLNCINKCETVNFHQTMTCNGVKFTPSCAGHVLGAAIFTIDIDGVVVVYTGDYSMEEDRHLSAAEIPVLENSPDVLIVESTYGTQVHSSRAEREYRFTKTAEDIVTRGGHALLPVFALGRAQELLLLLEEHWAKHAHLHQFPIFYASKVASKALRMYQTFINSMNTNVQRQLDVGNPFMFKHIDNINRLDTSAMGPCVVVAAPGMLQNGVSRQLFELWCEDARNGVLLAGYAVEGTLAKRLLMEPKEISCLDGRIKQRKCSIEYVSFSAHVDYVQNWSFIQSVTPDNIVLVHGEKGEMGRLKVELDREVSRGKWPDKTHKPSVLMPENGQSVKVAFKKNIVGYAVGKAASQITDFLDHSEKQEDLEQQRKGGTLPSSSLHVLVAQNFVFKVVSFSELDIHTPLRRGSIAQRQLVTIPPATHQLFSGGVVMNRVLPLVIVYPSIQQIFDGLDVDEDGNDTYAVVYHYTEIAKDALTSVGKLEDAPTRINGAVDLGANSAASLACSERDFITIGSAVKISYYEGENQNRCIAVEWTADPVYDWVAEAAICSLSYFMSIDNALRLTTSQAKAVVPAAADGAENSSDDILNKMRSGLIDPSKHSMLIDSDGDKTTRLALQRIKDCLSEQYCNSVWDMEISNEEDNAGEIDASNASSWFESVKLDQGGRRLIVTSSRLATSSGEAAAVAYVFVHFHKNSGKGCKHGPNEEGHGHCKKHHAVIQAENEVLKSQVKHAISTLDQT